MLPDESQLTTLPSIDMEAPEAEIVEQIMHQCENLGFFHIRNIAGFNEDELLRDLKEFHNLPDEVKHTLKQKVHNADNANIYRGFVPFLPNADSHKELLDMGCDYDTLTAKEKTQPLTEETPFP